MIRQRVTAGLTPSRPREAESAQVKGTVRTAKVIDADWAKPLAGCCSGRLAAKLAPVNGKQPSNKIWPAIIAMAIVVIALWIFMVLLRP